VTSSTNGRADRGTLRVSTLIDQRIVVRHAIGAARSALYHAELLRCAKGAWLRVRDDELDAAGKRARLLGDAAHHLGCLSSLIDSVNPDALKSESERYRDEIESFNEEIESRKYLAYANRFNPKRSSIVVERQRALLESWQAIGDRISGIDTHRPLGEWRVDAIHIALRTFLGLSRPRSRRFVDGALTYLRKHLLVLFGLILFGLLVLFVEPIAALLRERLGFALACAVLQVVVPWAVTKSILVSLRSRTRPHDDDGGYPAKYFNVLCISAFFHHPAMQYPLGTEAFAPRSPLLLKVLLGLCAKVAIYQALLFTLTLVMYLVAGYTDAGTRTIVLVFGAMSMVLIALHALDYFDWLEAAPTRVVSVLVVAALVGLCVVTECSYSAMGWIVLLLGVAMLALGVLGLIHRPFGYLLCTVGFVVAVSLFIADRRADDLAWTDQGLGADRPLITADHWPHRRSDSEGNAPPVIVVAASGGGSRAAYFTAKVFDALDNLCPGGKPTCAAPLGRHLQAISSVSGGSLANAAYVASRLHRDSDVPAKRGELSKAIANDFLGPVIRGALDPLTSRNEQLLADWNELFFADPDAPGGRGSARRPAGPTMGALARAWDPGEERFPRFPVPLINSTTLDSHAVVISPLQAAAYSDDQYETARKWCDKHLSDSDESTWVRFRSGIYGLDNLLARYDPDLAHATLASANFPFGFPLVTLKTKQPLVFSPVPSDRRAGAEKTVCLTDGGVLSNSGMWPLYHLLVNTAKAAPEDAPDSLERRGVILIVVDVSRMPDYHGRTESLDLYAAIGDQAPLGDNFHRRMFEALYETLNGRIAIVQIALEPIDEFNVYTSWALDKDSLASLDRQFDKQWQGDGEAHARKRILAAWRKLKRGDKRLPPPKTWVRAPID